MSEPNDNIDQIIEAALFSAGEPLTIERLQGMFAWTGRPSIDAIKASLERIGSACETRGVALIEVASGFRFQAKADYAEYLHKLWEKKPPKYSKALLETLALIIYRQPITRGEVEEVRGVAVSTNIIKTLQERDWIKVVGARDVPGKPALFGTTKAFLDDFNLQSLSELPLLQDVMDVQALEEKLGQQFSLPVDSDAESNDAPDSHEPVSDNPESQTHDVVNEGVDPIEEDVAEALTES